MNYHRIALAVLLLIVGPAALAHTYLKVPTDYSTIQAAHDHLSSSHASEPGTIYVEGDVTLTATVNISKGRLLITGNRPTIAMSSSVADEDVFYVTASNVTFENLIIRNQGANTNTQNGYENGIYFYGGTNGITDIAVRNCEIYDVDHWAIMLRSVTRSHIRGNHIHTYGRAGVQVAGGSHHVITDNIIRNCTAVNLNAYGIALSAISDVSMAYATDSVIANNVVDGVLSWVGIDTHGGRRIDIIGNTVRNARAGITASLTTAGMSDPGLEDINIVGNVVDGPGSTDSGSGLNSGIVAAGEVVSGTVTWAKRIKIADNTIRNFNAAESTPGEGGGIYTHSVEGLTITGNTIAENRGYGIMLTVGAKQARISNNLIYDNYKATGLNGIGIYLSGISQDVIGQISDNRISWSGNSSKEQEWGLRVDVSVSTYVMNNDLRSNSLGAAVNPSYYGLLMGNLHSQNMALVEKFTLGGGAKSWLYGTWTPSTCSQGDIVWNTTPTATTNVGWICTATNTWKTFGGIVP